MKTKTTWCAALVLVACGGLVEDEQEVATAERQIVSGNPRVDATFGGALVDAGTTRCSGAFLAPDLLLTHARCFEARTVSVGGLSYSVKLARRFQHLSAEVVALQLRREVKPPLNPRTITRTRVAVNERLSCFGFDSQGAFTSGEFTVSALSGDVIDLTGGFGFNGPFGVELSDDGGFCMRDGSIEIAAVLSASKYLTPRAVQVDLLEQPVVDIMAAVIQARSRSSVALVDDPTLTLPDALMLNSSLMRATLQAPRTPKQGFYLAPTSHPNVVSLVNANTGTCLYLSPAYGGTIGDRRCVATDTTQQWSQEYVLGVFGGGATNGYRYRALTNPALCLSVRGWRVDCNLPDANLGLWLNPF